MTTTVSISGDPMLALAALLVERDELRVDLDQQARAAAESEEKRALGEQLEHLHEAADDVRVGAWVQGGLAIAGSAASALGAGLQPCAGVDASASGAADTLKASEAARQPGLDALMHSGAGLAALAQPIGRLQGEAPRMEHETHAKQAEARRSDAHARAEEAAAHQNRVNDGSSRSLSALETALATAAQGNLAIIANV